MKRVFAAFILLINFATPSTADSCDDLITSFEGALAAPDLSPAMRSQLEQLLGAGREAKARGDVAACEAARNAPMRSSPGDGRGGANRECEKKPETV